MVGVLEGAPAGAAARHLPLGELARGLLAVLDRLVDDRAVLDAELDQVVDGADLASCHDGPPQDAVTGSA